MRTVRRGLTYFAAAVALSTTGFAVSARSAETWEASIMRGLPVYSATQDGGKVVIVCDPDRVYNPDRNAGNIVVTMPTDRSARELVFLSSTGTQAAFEVRDGVATSMAARPGQWDALREIVEQGGQFAVVTARDRFVLDMEPMPDFNCR